MAQLQLVSPAFEDGESIPREYGYTERNVNPPLEIDAVPDDAASLALIVDDPDAVEPAGKVWDHWVVWNIDPDTETIPEDSDATNAVEGHNDYRERRYGGPNPPDRKHSYRFRLYALGQQVDLDAGATKDSLLDAIQGHVVDETQLEGTYAP
ncbi:YbhB/YbcL family Raf kinase inhibitor-like protein [Halohasta salina]|uniref:YbhB/YbcL family Raf kinase inhibitor-like protein n=1 Tax=Halohasta salina TaxID=2961621 RepID=UPI0020A373B6|nr:YbhB/YbcL family Raf kinase inhibitor-like protein [Halohasta salina]